MNAKTLAQHGEISGLKMGWTRFHLLEGITNLYMSPARAK